MLIKKQKIVDLKEFNNSKAFIEYSNDMDNTDKEHKILIVFDDMIDDMFSNKKLNPTVTDIFIRDIKLNIYLVFIVQSCFTVSESIRLTATH